MTEIDYRPYLSLSPKPHVKDYSHLGGVMVRALVTLILMSVLGTLSNL